MRTHAFFDDGRRNVNGGLVFLGLLRFQLQAIYDPALHFLPRINHYKPPPTMSFFRITLHRSAIGLPERTRGVLAALGLRRRMQTVFHPVHPQFAGMILKVKELVRVEEVDRALSKREVKAARTPDPGFYVEKAVPRM
ncbi:putative ribosomal protein L30 [Fusarium proliferatum ET1]|uniref:Large ribosomal subunit protein uL30m n=1 Tax=Fusarium proliferatum (strain ET1) TaxID=1227346 RepID=A0A1L7VDY6_FUSPR|nr:putative ribosomal protein L30 [Fusarium proliferatum ET1]CVK87921.1 probable ribosomal protein L30 [Fusarium proliferatum]CZR38879.1 probable ribosomal protein L30 [Fusarium proliferatum ET1]